MAVRPAGFDADYGFVCLHLRMGRGRSAAVHLQAGQKLDAVVKAHFAPLLVTRPVGVTLQIDEGPEVFDAKNSSLHPCSLRKPDRHARRRHHRRAGPPAVTRPQDPHAAAPFLEAAPRDDDRRR